MTRYFYCSSCKAVHTLHTFDINISNKNNNLKLNKLFEYKCNCGEIAEEIDPGMINIIKKLNDINLKTSFCCEGHMKKVYGSKEFSSPYIVFHNDITYNEFESITNKYELPYGWVIEYNPTDDNSVGIRWNLFEDWMFDISKRKFNNIKKQYLKKLEKWVDSMVSHHKWSAIYDRLK